MVIKVGFSVPLVAAPNGSVRALDEVRSLEFSGTINVFRRRAQLITTHTCYHYVDLYAEWQMESFITKRWV